MNKQQYELNNWFITSHGGLYDPPELHTQCLVGERFDDFVRTSRIVGKHGDLIVTKNSVYKLLDVDKTYDAEYPNAKERLLASLPEVGIEVKNA